jgi:hypothetical protein
MPVTIVRRFFYIFVDNFHWVGTIALWYAWRHTPMFRTRAWAVTGVVAFFQTLAVSTLGGAALERYLMPVLPLFYIAVAAALTSVPVRWRRGATLLMTAGLIAAIFLNSPFAYPFENNAAVVSFVRLQQRAAEFVQAEYPAAVVYSAWPLPDALRRPEFGYVRQPMQIKGLDNFNPETVLAHAGRMDVLVVYSRTWEPSWGALRSDWIRSFLTNYYFYQPQITKRQIEEQLGMQSVARWEQQGQWIEVYARGAPPHVMIL